MLIKKHLIEIERRINVFVVEYKKNNRAINSLVNRFCKQGSKRKCIINLKLEMDKYNAETKEINKGVKAFITQLAETKADLNVQNYHFLKIAFGEIFSSHKYQFQLFEKIGSMIQRIKIISLNLPKIYETIDQYSTKKSKLHNMLLKKIHYLLYADFEYLYNTYTGNKLPEMECKKRIKIELGKKKIFLEVSGTSQLSTDKIGEETIYGYFMRRCDEILGTDGLDSNLEKHCLKIKKMKDIQIEQELVNLTSNTIVVALKNNPFLIRSSRVNIYVITESHENAFLGRFMQDKSNYSQIFMSLRLLEETFEAFLGDKMTTEMEGQYYQCIVHEFTHAYDWFGKISDEEYQFVHDFIDEEPMPETLALGRLLFFVRSEALACLSGFQLRNYTNPANDILVLSSYGEVFINFGQNQLALKEIFTGAALESSNVETIQANIESLSGNVVTHRFGLSMAYVILIAHLYKEFTFWLCGDGEMRETLEKETGDLKKIAKEHGWKRVRHKIGKYIGSDKGLTFVLPRESFAKVYDVIVAISSMSIPKFFSAYLHGCKRLGINPEPLCPQEFAALNSVKKKQIKELISKLGF